MKSVFDVFVEVVEGESHLLCEHFAEGCLACTHITYKDYLFHSVLCFVSSALASFLGSRFGGRLRVVDDVHAFLIGQR